MPPILIDTNVLVYASDPAGTVRQDQALSTLKFLETTIFSEDFSDGQVLEGVRFVNLFADGFRFSPQHDQLLRTCSAQPPIPTSMS